MSRLTTFIIGLALLVGVAGRASGILRAPARVRAYGTLTLDFRLNHVAVIGDSYTTGTDEGGLGPKSWTARAWQTLARARRADRGRCGGRGQGRLRGARRPRQHLRGSDRQGGQARRCTGGVLRLPQRPGRRSRAAGRKGRATPSIWRAVLAPSARFLVIGPPWPTADVPVPILRDPRRAQRRGPGRGSDVRRSDRRALVRRQARPDRRRTACTPTTPGISTGGQDRTAHRACSCPGERAEDSVAQGV